MTRCRMLLSLVLLGAFHTEPASAQVNVNIQIGEPPPVVVYSPPTMVLLPEPQMYVAVGVPYDIYFVGGRYYYLHGNNWFWGTRYGGPWTHVTFQKLPPGLRKFKIKQLHDFRDREYKVYKAKGPKFNGKYFVAEAAGDHAAGKGGGNGKGNGKGNNGRGKKK